MIFAMNKRNIYLLILLFFSNFASLAFNIPHFNYSDPDGHPIPPGFQLVLADLGTKLYKKDYSGGNPDFVQLIDLSFGASLHLLYGPISKKGKGKGVYGGDNPEFESLSLLEFWDGFSTEESDAFCITNGQFFFMQKYPYKLAYPMKVQGEILTDGFENKFYPEEKLLLEIWEHRADIRKASKIEFYASTAPDIIGGLTENANRKGKFHVGRTFIGLDDNNHDGVFETVLIFNTLSASQADAANTLREFGADKIMMLDGGGSTQLYCRNKWYVQSERLIPQAIGITAASGPSFAAEISTLPPYQIISAGESFTLTVKIQNTGHNKWIQDTDRISLAIPAINYLINDQFSKVIEPGENTSFIWEIPPIQDWGSYEAAVSIKREKQPLPNSQQVILLNILPDNLSAQKQELIDLIERNNLSSPQKNSELFNEWVQSKIITETRIAGTNQESHAVSTALNFNYKNILCIPIIMLPFVIIILIIIDMRRTK